MAILTKMEFEQLANEKSKYCISIYIPTHRRGDNKDSKIRFKNNISHAESRLSEAGVKQKDIEIYMEPLNNLLNDTGFWRHLSDALICLRSSQNFFYATLPLDVMEITSVSDSFYLLPLFSTFNNNDRFFILILSMNENRLYEATQNSIKAINTDGIFPENKLDSSGKDVKQKSLQFRSGHARGELGLFHGKGEGKDDSKTETIKYFSDIDRGLGKALEGYNFPLIIASVENMFSLFKEISSYKNIFPEPVTGNYDHENSILVHEKACEILSPYFAKIKNQRKAEYLENNSKSISNIQDLAIAANLGRIETLFVKKYTQIWGTIKPKTGTVEIHKDKKILDNCLLDLIARKTFLKGGNVFLENFGELPEPDTPAYAILRY